MERRRGSVDAGGVVHHVVPRCGTFRPRRSSGKEQATAAPRSPPCCPCWATAPLRQLVNDPRVNPRAWQHGHDVDADQGQLQANGCLRVCARSGAACAGGAAGQRPREAAAAGLRGGLVAGDGGGPGGGRRGAGERHRQQRLTRNRQPTRSAEVANGASLAAQLQAPPRKAVQSPLPAVVGQQ